MSENKGSALSPYIVPVVLGGGAIWLLYKGGSAIGKKFGIIKDDSPEAQHSTALLEADYLQHNYLTNLPKGQKVYGWSGSTADDIAKKVYDSKGFFNDNETQFWAAIKRILYKTQAAKVSQAFYKKYGKDMPEYLNSFLNQKEMSRLYDYLNKLPTGLI